MRRKRLFVRFLAWLLAAVLLVLVVSACAPTQPAEDAEAEHPVAEVDTQNDVGDSVADAPASADSVPGTAQMDTSTVDPAPAPENTAEPSDVAVAADGSEATSENEATSESEATPEAEAASEAEATPESEAAPESEAVPESEATPENEATSPLFEDPTQEDPQADPEPAALESEPVGATEEPALPTDVGQGESVAPSPEEPPQEVDQATADAVEQGSGPTGTMEESPPQGAAETDAPVEPTDSESVDAEDSLQDAHPEEAAYWNPVPAPGESEPGEDLRPVVTLMDLEGVYAVSGCDMELSLTIYAAIDGRAPGYVESAKTGIQGCLATLENDLLVLQLIDHSVMRFEIVSPTALRDPETFTVLRKQ